MLADYKDAVKEGNGQQLHTIHKQLLNHFKSDPGFNTYAIEMFINIVQNDILLSQGEAHHCVWATTANWKGGKGQNIETGKSQQRLEEANQRYGSN